MTRNLPMNIDMARVEQTGMKLTQLRDELTQIFPEREHLINQILFALLTREHVLIHGIFGTGKSDLVHTLFDVFTDSTKFSIALNKFMTEAHLIGIPDPEKMRSGQGVQYDRVGGILDAHFVELDEIFDASAPLLRTMLGILNERQFKRGRQLEYAKLHTAIGSTNADPTQQVLMSKDLGAVVDRFIFQSKVVYLTKPESRRQMYAKYLTGAKPTVTIEYGELESLSGIVVSANQITNPQFIDVYDAVLEAYRKVVPGVSDRRACKLLKIIEANALLHGRYDVDFDDIYAIRWGLCLGGDEVQHKQFEQAAKPIIERAIAQQDQSIDEVQIQLLKELEQRIPTLPQTTTDAELVAIKRSLNEIREQTTKVKPKLGSTNDIKTKVLDKIDRKLVQVTKRIDGK